MHSFQYAPDYTLIYMEPFIHLHVHTQYSLLDGQASIDALIDKAQKDGMPAIAVTDHGVMFGIKEFFNKVSKKNGKPLGAIKDYEKELKELKSKTELTAEEQAREEEKQRKLKLIREGAGYVHKELVKAGLISEDTDLMEGLTYKQFRDKMYDEQLDAYYNMKRAD